MSKILHIISSANIKTNRGSISTLAGEIFLDFYKQKYPNDEIITLNLNNENVGNITLTSKNASTFFVDGISDQYINQLKEVEKVVLCASIINFNYSSTLKNYFDHILVAKKSFVYKYDRNGISEGLLKHLKVQIIAATEVDKGSFIWGNAVENLRGTWEFVGANVARPLVLYGTKTPKFIKKTTQEIVDPYVEALRVLATLF